ncbi:hypothetical protein BDZ45DRAFT_746186 [Acephala macrosclerotiorum]|nr:hypothetical protein BDZ45DRAFT_746186 [Acephala macrosclerotiorum]
MAYTSVYKDIWHELKRGRRHRRQDRRPTREGFERVAEAFYQAEWCPHSERISFEATRYRAEYNIWAYYFGEDGEFPGKDPATSTPRPWMPFEHTTSSQNYGTSSSSESPQRYGMFGMTSPELRAVTAQADWVSHDIANKPRKTNQYHSISPRLYENRDPFHDGLGTDSPSPPPLLSSNKLTTSRRRSNASSYLSEMDGFNSTFTTSEHHSGVHKSKRRYRSPSGYRFTDTSPRFARRSASPFADAGPSTSRRKPNASTSSSRMDHDFSVFPSERPSNPHQRKRLNSSPAYPPGESKSKHLPDPVRDAVLICKHRRLESGSSIYSFNEGDEPIEPSAWLMQHHLEQKWKTREAFQNYKPQLGFNPSIGEPWLSIRCYAEDAYPSLSGQRHRYLLSLKKKIPKFEIQYERFEKGKDWGHKYLLIWPEFRDPKDLDDEGLWEEFGELRAFLESWAKEEKPGPIFKAYGKWLELPKYMRKGLELPEGFPIEDFQKTVFSHHREREYHGRKDMRAGREGSRDIKQEGSFCGSVRERSRGRDLSRSMERESRFDRFMGVPSRGREGRHESYRGRKNSQAVRESLDEGRYSIKREPSSIRNRSRGWKREGIQGRERSGSPGLKYYGHGLRSEQRYRGREREQRPEMDRGRDYNRGTERDGGREEGMRQRSRLRGPRYESHYYRFDPPYDQSLDLRYLGRGRQKGSRMGDTYRPRYESPEAIEKLPQWEVQMTDEEHEHWSNSLEIRDLLMPGQI